MPVMPFDVQMWVKKNPTCATIYILDAVASELDEAELAGLCAAVADGMQSP
ncbi:hypothetical protein [Streptomyces sp. NPDC127040]|uniref:hypothetical protein n=1 Tax=Streptomyces sp. NPDC127040 TaxID=3347116 RepID=UPI00365367BE